MSGNVFGLLSKPLREQVEVFGWECPTRIQELALPAILMKENVLLIAPTGTGKTEAAVLPVFELLLRCRSQEQLKGIGILYITPLRALNRDIFRRLIAIGERLEIRVEVRHGDTTQRIRRLQALSPPQMLITTPETFQAILPGRRMQRHLGEVRWVIVDEAHELATDKRGAQLSIGLERLREILGREFQRIGLSATVGDSDVIGRFLTGEGRSFKVLRSVEPKDIEVKVESPSPMVEDDNVARHLMLPAASVRRIQRILELVRLHKSTLIFTNTREHAEALSSRILALKPEIRVGVHHGSLSKEARTETEMELKEGKLGAVVCTSSLELGIDIGDVDFVIQYMSPRQVTKLVQRVGRSGHIVGGKSLGVILASWPDDILESAVIGKFAEEGVLEEPSVHRNPLDVLAHQVAGLALEWGRIRIDDISRIVRRSWLFKDIMLEDIVAVVEQLGHRRVIWFDGETVRRRFPNTFGYYYSNLSMIADVKHYNVVDFLNRRRIGTLDQEFVSRNGKPGQEFVIYGQTWRIVGIDEDESLVQVEPAPQSFGAIPAWEGEIIPVPYEVAQRVGRVRGEIETQIRTGGGPEETLTAYSLTPEGIGKIVDFTKRQLQGGYPVPTDRRIVIESYENFVTIHACFGDLVNETLSKALASILSSRFGVNIATQADPYRIAFIAPIYIDPQTVKKDLSNLLPEELDQLLEATLSDTSLLAWRLWNVAKRFGIVERDAEFTSSRGRILASALRETPVYKETVREIYVDKMDVEYTKRVLLMIKEGEVEVVSVPRGREYSPFNLPILDRIAPQDVLRPVVPTKAILDVVKERLNTSETRLICLYKADYDGIRTIRTLPDRVKCPHCGSTLLAATYRGDDHLAEVIRKKLGRKPLTLDEEKMWQTAWRSASLVQTYGKKALIVMAGRGVGPTNATRILHSYHRTEEDLYLDVVKAERNFLRTRMFWET